MTHSYIPLSRTVFLIIYFTMNRAICQRVAQNFEQILKKCDLVIAIE
jgi:hypothetical protein